MARHHHLHSPYRRGFYSLGLIAAMLTLGTLTLHSLEKFSYVDSFYFTSMIATGQGPVGNPAIQTVAGKLFISVFAFLSVGILLASLGFVFGPFLGKLWHIGILKFEEEIGILPKEKDKRG